ncbi:hypothetical protein JW933_06295 [candidate division FCPU426 bacterium]|nr:hypothetical protein [candidate division FCPU426 bacterium]
MEFIHHPFIQPMLLPLAGGLLCFLIPRAWSRVCGWLAVLISAATCYLVWPLFLAAPQILDLAPAISLKIDKLSGFILLLTAIFAFLISLYSVGYIRQPEQQKPYFTYFLWTLAAAVGVLLANELILLLCFWGFLGLTLYLLIALNGPQASSAAKKTFIIIGASDSIFILGIAFFGLLTGSTRMDGPAVPLNHPHTYIALAAFIVAAFAKAGVMPFHSWVPDCGEKALLPVSAFLPASLDKFLGIYLLLRTAKDLFVLTTAVNLVLLLAGASTVLLAVMLALVQHDLKRLLSYHAVSQVGYMVLGIGTGLPIGMAGSLFHMLNNAVYKSALFLCAGAVESQTQTADMDKLGGLAKAMPLTFITCLVASLSIAGIPPLNGFVSKWMVYQGLIESGSTFYGSWIIWLAVAILGSALTLASFVKVLHAVFLTKAADTVRSKTIREVGWRQTLPMLVLSLACLLFGMFAYRLPLAGFIYPALRQEVVYPGIWWAGPAAFLMGLGIMMGFIFSLLAGKGKTRIAPTYIGGETLAGEVQVTGVDFYHTYQSLSLLKRFYRLAESKWFDVYDAASKIIFYFVELLRSLHTGRLPLYLIWVLCGLVLLLFLLLH